MKKRLAQEIFEEIRDRPFRVATTFQKPANNCYFKGMELVQILTSMGFAVRGRIGEIDWANTPCPPEILKLASKEITDTHFYQEIFIDGEWKIIDATFNKSFAQKFGMPYSEFGQNNVPCFTITKDYNEEKQATYAHGWQRDSHVIEHYTQKMAPFLHALNEWLEEVNP